MLSNNKSRLSFSSGVKLTVTVNSTKGKKLKTAKLFLVMLLSVAVASCGGGGEASPASPVPAPKWTYMVYIAGDNSLSDAVSPDIQEMMAVGSNAAINVVVQAELNPTVQAGTGRGRIVKNMPASDWQSVGPATGGGVDMTNPQTLTDFILWAKNTYPAENYALVLWSHGGGWKTQKLGRGALQDITSAGASAPMMSLNNMVKAVSDSGVHFGLINFDACLMGMYEVGYAFRNVADYLVASEEVEPGDGDDYTAILTALTTTPTMTASTLSATIVSTYRSFYATQGRSSVTKSVIDLTQIAALSTAVDNLATVMTNGMGTLRTSIQSAQVATANYEYTTNRDLSDFAAQLKVSSADAALVSAATAVQTAVSNAVVSNQIYTPDSTKLINRSKGIAIYLPTKAEAISGDLTDYGLLDTSLNGAGAQSAWAGFVNLLVTGDTVNNYIQKAPGNFGYVLTWDNPAVDLDLYMYEPVNLAAPWMGTTTANGFMSADSSETGVQAEYYVAAPTVEAGQYDVFVNYFGGVGTTTATLYYDGGTGAGLVVVATFILKDATKPDSSLAAFPDTDYVAMLANTYGNWHYDHSHLAVYDPTIIRMLTPQKQPRLLSGKALSQRAHFRAQQKAGKTVKFVVVK